MKAFISYSHHDAEFLTALHQHLAGLRRQKVLETWTDREIDAGGVLDDEIATAMGKADLFLLLISSSFINSDYCYEKEFKKALKKQKAGKAIIVPIIVRPCDWLIPELRQFKALPDDGKAVHSKHWHSADEAFADVAKGLRTLVESRSRVVNKFHPDDPHFTTDQREQIENRAAQPDAKRSPKFPAPSLPFAIELLEMIHEHPNEDERGLTEILHDSTVRVLYRAFIPNTTAAGDATSVKKLLFAPAVAELVRLGWLLQPDGNTRVRIYELNPETKGVSS